MSNIKKSQRHDTGLEFFDFGIEITNEIRKNICSTFGFEDLYNNLVVFEDFIQMSEYDKGDFRRLIQKYPEMKVENGYTAYLIDSFRNRLTELCFIFEENLVRAYSIFPNSEEQIKMKTRIQQELITNISTMILTIQQVLDLMKNVGRTSNINKLTATVEKLNIEDKYLRNYKRSNNKQNKAIRRRLAAEEIRDSIIDANYKSGLAYHTITKDLDSRGILDPSTVSVYISIYDSKRKYCDKTFKEYDKVVNNNNTFPAIVFLDELDKVPPITFNDFRIITDQAYHLNVVVNEISDSLQKSMDLTKFK